MEYLTPAHLIAIAMQLTGKDFRAFTNQEYLEYFVKVSNSAQLEYKDIKPFPRIEDKIVETYLRADDWSSNSIHPEYAIYVMLFQAWINKRVIVDDDNSFGTAIAEDRAAFGANEELAEALQEVLCSRYFLKYCEEAIIELPQSVNAWRRAAEKSGESLNEYILSQIYSAKWYYGVDNSLTQYLRKEARTNKDIADAMRTYRHDAEWGAQLFIYGDAHKERHREMAQKLFAENKLFFVFNGYEVHATIRWGTLEIRIYREGEPGYVASRTAKKGLRDKWEEDELIMEFVLAEYELD